MAQGVSPLDTAHQGPIHAAQLDHFGRQLATASADGTVRVWDVETRCFKAELRGHDEKLVRDVAWAHPMHGGILASAGEDKHVVFWKEAADGEWCEIYRHRIEGAALAIAFAPWEYGFELAVGSSDGKVVIVSLKGNLVGYSRQTVEGISEVGGWEDERFNAHEGGTFAVCWAPAMAPSVPDNIAAWAKIGNLSAYDRRLVTGGADSQVRIWRHDEINSRWDSATPPDFGEHADWIRDVAWRPNVGIPSNTIASCGEDGTVVIWMQPQVEQHWARQKTFELDAAAWQLSWSLTGSILAVSTSKNEVVLFKESLEGTWERVEAFNEQAAEDSPAHPPTSSPVRGEV